MTMEPNLFEERYFNMIEDKFKGLVGQIDMIFTKTGEIKTEISEVKLEMTEYKTHCATVCKDEFVGKEEFKEVKDIVVYLYKKWYYIAGGFAAIAFCAAFATKLF